MSSPQDLVKKLKIPKKTVQTDPYEDPQKIFPKREYSNAPSTNLEARGIEENNLYIGGGDVEVDLELQDYVSSTAPLNQVRRTVSGHVQEVDDTPGRERMLFKHKTGAGVEMRADGTVVISSTNNTIRVSGGDEKVIIEGNGQIVYHGNLRMRVDGDFDLDVGGHMNVNVAGDQTYDIKGGYRQDVNGNHQTIVNADKSNIITGTETNYVSGSLNEIIKGDLKTTIGGQNQHAVKGVIHNSSETRVNTTSPDINIGSTHINVISDEGTIGGENIVMYNYNMYTGHSITAGDTVTVPVVYGDLEGTSRRAVNADTAHSQSYGDFHGDVGSSPGYTVDNTPVDTKATVLPTNSVMKNDWFNSEYGLFKVIIDAGNVIYNSINKLFDYNNISKRKMTTKEVRSKLRDDAIMINEEFIGRAVADGLLSSSYANQVPVKTGQIISSDPTPRNAQSKQVFGKLKGAEAKRYAGSASPNSITIQPNPRYDPASGVILSSKTKLARGVTISKFLGGHGDPIALDDISVSLAKNLYLHAQLIKSVTEDEGGEFENFRLIVSEGVYKKGSEPVTTGSINDLRSSGRAIVYELRDKNGNISFDKTFRLAAWWKDSQFFEKMILDYDTYNSDGSLSVQIIVIMPELDGYTGNFKNQIETRFNNYVQSTNEIIEILQ